MKDAEGANITLMLKAGKLQLVQIAVFYDLPFESKKSPDFYDFESEEKAIEGVKALITINKVTV